MAVDAVTVRGLKEAQAVFRQLPDVARDAYVEIAVRPTASELVRDAQSRLIPGHGFVTGALKRSLGYTLNARTGQARVGIRRGFDVIRPGRNGSALTSRGAFKHQPTKIGHLVEFGHGGPHPAPPHPFMVIAAEGQQAPFLSRARAAGRRIEGEMAAIGARYL